ncbi:hypothetical protein [Dactylosporangium matsuzakiense]|uniref:Glycosyltransferase RgtA/B/C/D-like domain-containing protein n=1 Tax=Dactylosporangium matsuzakiense TaxID=53360 RepID=A0A9W6KRN0_9ACTN|nr:hypothetical protein [Dactylosporangium matsuzakiense]UWZ47405.1 hypothetical protein Dmats_13945 [Dactylosporangium matsuzakiense]GLL05150.1 hypothetical protein GCM10017581_068970 [Dactylosporangium matsuzakiense]
MTNLLTAVVLVAAGLPLAFALTRSWPLALVLAPIAAAAVATSAVLLMLATGGPMLLWFLPVYLGTLYLAWSRRGRARLGSWRDALLMAVPLVPPFLPIAQQPLLWDAHLIWWLHAGYFAEGGGFARDSIGNPALIFSHPDYPPFASAPVALVWQTLGTRDFYPAAIVTGLVTFSAIAAAVFAVRVVTAQASSWIAWPAAVAVGLSAWSPLWAVPTAGFSDAMCAGAFTAGAMLLLFGRRPFGPLLPLTLVLLSGAALMKNEGQSMVVALAVVATVRYRRQGRLVGWVWLPVAFAAVWSLTARLLGAQTDVLAGGKFGDLLHGDADTWGRLPLILSTMAGRVERMVPLAIAAAILGWLLLRRRRQELGLGGDGWLWAVAAIYWGFLTLIYVVTPNDLHWHLSTSVDRVVIPIVMLSCASAACWAVTALHRPADQSAAVRHPADSPPEESDTVAAHAAADQQPG